MMQRWRQRKAGGRGGFTLAEVALTAVIVASFVGATIGIADQIGTARIEGLAQRNRNTWANVQSQLAAQGIAAQSDAAIWAQLGFSSVAGSTDFSIDSQTTSPGAVTFGDNGAVVGPVVLSINDSEKPLGIRASMRSVGFRLLDHVTATGSYQEDKPGALFDPQVGVSVAQYDAGSGSYTSHQVSLGNGVTNVPFDAWAEIDWNAADAPVIYLLASSKRLPEDGVYYSFGSDEPTTPMPGRTAADAPAGISDYWSYVVPVPLDQLTSDPGNASQSTIVLNVRGNMGQGQMSATKSMRLVITKVPLQIVMRREAPDGTFTDDTNITLADVVPNALARAATPITVDRATVGTRSYYMRLAGPNGETLPQGMVDLVNNNALRLSSAFVNGPTITTQGATGDAASGMTLSDVPVEEYKQYPSSTQNIWRGTLDSSSPLVLSLSRDVHVTTQPTYLPHVSFAPAGGTAGSPCSCECTFDLARVVDDQYEGQPNKLDLPGVSDGTLYSLEYSEDGADWHPYSKPFSVGGGTVYDTQLAMQAHAVRKVDALSPFLLSRTPDEAYYKKHIDASNFDAKWNYGGSDAQAKKWSTVSSWSFKGGDPSAYPNGPTGLNRDGQYVSVLFSDILPNDGTITVTNPPNPIQINTMVLESPPQGVVLDPTGGGGSIEFRSANSNDPSQLVVYQGDQHTIRAPITLYQHLDVRTDAAATKVALAGSITNAPNQTYSINKVGPGTLDLSGAVSTRLTLNAASDGEANPQDNVVRLSTSQTMINVDPAGQSQISFNGGTMSLGDGSVVQTYGVARVTADTWLQFGNGSTFEPDNLEVASGVTLQVSGFDETDNGSNVKDRFLARYPGLSTLQRIRYPDTQLDPNNPSTVPITARWTTSDVTNNVAVGSILPRRPPASTGVGYINVSSTSQIKFTGTSKLSAQDVDVFGGATLEILNWDGSDVFTVETNTGQASLDTVRQHIKFYSGSNNKTGYLGTATLQQMSVLRNGISVTVYALKPQ